jgi:hypothetical protein
MPRFVELLVTFLASLVVFSMCGCGGSPQPCLDDECLEQVELARRGLECWPRSKCPVLPPVPPSPPPEEPVIPPCKYELKADGKLYWCCPQLTDGTVLWEDPPRPVPSGV